MNLVGFQTPSSNMAYFLYTLVLWCCIIYGLVHHAWTVGNSVLQQIQSCASVYDTLQWPEAFEFFPTALAHNREVLNDSETQGSRFTFLLYYALQARSNRGGLTR